MRRSIALTLMATIVLGLSLGTLAPVAALDKTPTLTGADSAWSGVPPAADCLIEPTDVKTIVDALKQLPSAEDQAAFPITLANESDLPDGDEPEDDELEAVSAAMWTTVACLNAGDYSRFFASLSPQGISGFIQGILGAMGGTTGPLSEEALLNLEVNLSASLSATPTSVAAESQVRIDKIRDARVLEDGRIVILVDGTVGVSATVYAVFKKIDDRWLIDAIGQIGELPA